MAQYARPASDISAGGWTDEGTVDNDGYLYTSIDEATSDGDSSYILGQGGDTTAEVKLNSVTDPESSSGHVLHVLFRTIGSGAGEKLDIELVQASTVICALGNETNRSETYLDVNYTLSGTEADSITDYSDLRIRCIVDTCGSSEEIRVTQAYLELPEADVYVTPGVASAIASGQDPAIVLGSVSVTPGLSSGIGSALDPVVVLDSMIVTPAIAEAIASGQDPDVVLGSIVIVPAIVLAIGSLLDPGVILGSMIVTPAIAEAIASALDPVIPDENVYVTPDVAEAVPSALDPVVVLGSIVLIPEIAAAIGQALDPIIVLDSMIVTPEIAAAVASALDPDVILDGGAVAEWLALNLPWTFGVGGRRGT